MEIKPIQNYYKTQATANSANTKKTVEESSAPVADTRGADKIDISAEASFKAELGKYARTYAARSTEEASTERISELKQQYQGDTCPISGSDIAAKIISGILGPGAKD
ncbi:MAG: flagellar biosynthesis anti-sigma factor FlgM [Oscillospiraceae bacterium]